MPAQQSTVNHYYRVLNSFFAWLQREEIRDDNPVSRINTPRLDKKVVQALSADEVKRLLVATSAKTFVEVRNRAIFMVLLDSGLRISELAGLDVSDVDPSTGGILVRRGKGGKGRVVRIGVKAQQALWRYVGLGRRGTNPRLFLRRDGEPLKLDSVKRIVIDVGRKVGVDGVHAHRLRHTFAISYLRNGGDIFSLKYLLGHSSLSMVQHYLGSLSAEDAARAHKRFSPMDNPGG